MPPRKTCQDMGEARSAIDAIDRDIVERSIAFETLLFDARAGEKKAG